MIDLEREFCPKSVQLSRTHLLYRPSSGNQECGFCGETRAVLYQRTPARVLWSTDAGTDVLIDGAHIVTLAYSADTGDVEPTHTARDGSPLYVRYIKHFGAPHYLVVNGAAREEEA